MALSIKAFSVQRSAFSVQRSAFSVQRSAFHALALSLLLLCSTVIESGCSPNNPTTIPAAGASGEGRIVNGKWDGWLNVKDGDKPAMLVKNDTRAVEGAPCNQLMAWARDADDHALICVNDPPAQVPAALKAVDQNGAP
jgi:hypothetical protein